MPEIAATTSVRETAHDEAFHAQVIDAVQQYWGFDSLRPLQAEAIAAGIEHRDSLVVMPTGGGKSLCYQVPPLIAERTDVVISPLISLMKDQVDALQQCGYPAAAVYSGLDATEKRQIHQQLVNGDLRLLFISPERIVSPRVLKLLDQINVRSFSIDEAHCISQWGHDFRQEYRRLGLLKERFPGASVHAYTATATPRVREDIVAQLGLHEPNVLIGTFDRPNLVYRILPRVDRGQQILEIIRRHPREAVIVYCISRKDTEQLAGTLNAHGINAAAYHAGLESDERRRVQDAFAAEQVDVVVATVAFGMGIDRSNVRCVIHAAMPKSVEAYQQETGRAGRDGLEAECVLLYSAADVMKWESLIQKSAAEAQEPAEVAAAHLDLLHEMQRFCSAPMCRHVALSRYFGQELDANSSPLEGGDQEGGNASSDKTSATHPPAPSLEGTGSYNCQACDVCLEEVEGLEDATTLAQKVISCVARTGQCFGVGHIVDVLLGANTEMIRRNNHEQLTTYGLLKDYNKKSLLNLVYQLLDQDLIGRTEGDRPTLFLNDQSKEVLRGERPVRLFQPKEQVKQTGEEASWQGVDRDLFERLREWRMELAQQREVPAFVILGDSTLRALARVRPSNRDALKQISGIGQKKLDDLGEQLLAVIETYCSENDVERDQPDVVSHAPASRVKVTMSEAKNQSFALFEQGKSPDEVAEEVGRSPKTVWGYLAEFVQDRKPATLEPWADDAMCDRVLEAVEAVGADRLRPIYEHLGESVPYEIIRLVLVHDRVRRESECAPV